MSCTMAQTGGLLDRARRGEELSVEERSHLDACAACRAACERGRRLVATWLADRPADLEIDRARARWRRSRVTPATSFDPGILRWAAGGAAIAVALVVAASGLERANGKVEPRGLEATAPAGAKAAQAVLVRGDTRVPAADGLVIRLGRDESADVVGASGAVLALHGAATVVLRADESMACGFRAEQVEVGLPEPAASAALSAHAVARPLRDAASAAAPAVVATAAEPEAPPPPSAAPSASGWAQAAEAMRNGRIREADRALADLSQSADARERDAAKLARAELWMANGHAAEARPLLAELAGQGATPLVRKRAQALLAGER